MKEQGSSNLQVPSDDDNFLEFLLSVLGIGFEFPFKVPQGQLVP